MDTDVVLRLPLTVVAAVVGLGAGWPRNVGRCRLNPGWSHVVPVLEANM